MSIRTLTAGLIEESVEAHRRREYKPAPLDPILLDSPFETDPGVVDEERAGITSTLLVEYSPQTAPISRTGIRSRNLETHWEIPGGIAARFALPDNKQISELPAPDPQEITGPQSPESDPQDMREVSIPSEEDRPTENQNQDEAAPITIELQSH